MATAKKESKNTDRAQATRNHIIQTYLKLMLHRNWNRISVKELCAEAAITRGTFYQYFDSMTDLMDGIENTTLGEIEAVLRAARLEFKPQRVLYASDFDRDYSNTPSEYSVRWFEYCKAHPLKMLALMNREFGDVRFIDRVQQFLSQAISHSMNSEGLPNDAFRQQYLSLYTDMYVNAIFTWLQSESNADPLTPMDMAVVLDSIRTGGLYMARRNRLAGSGKNDKCEEPKKGAI